MKYIDEIQKFCETESEPYRRPFSPNPDWENADVMIIGTNPATKDITFNIAGDESNLKKSLNLDFTKCG